MVFVRTDLAMAGEYTDNYYYQLVAHVRKYKGMIAADAPSAPHDRRRRELRAMGGHRFRVPRSHPRHAASRLRRIHRPRTERSALPSTTSTTPGATKSSKHARQWTPKTSILRAIEGSALASDRPRVDDVARLHRWRRTTGFHGYDFLVNGARGCDERVARTLGRRRVGRPAFGSRRPLRNSQIQIRVARADLRQGAHVAFGFHWVDDVDMHALSAAGADLPPFLSEGDGAPDRRFDFCYVDP